MSQPEAELTGQVEQLRQAVMQLQQIVSQLLTTPTVHLDVQHMDVEHLSFNLPGIAVEDLSGQLNLGLTHILQTAPPPSPGPDDAGDSAPEESNASPPEGEAPSTLWPPPSEEVQQAP